MTVVTHRINPYLVRINGLVCSRTTAKKSTRCVHSLKPIKPGDAIYRPLGNHNFRSARWLADEIEALEHTVTDA